MPARTKTPWRRLAGASLVLLAAMAAAHAQCKYKRIGAVATRWEGARLMIDGSINDHPMAMAIDTGAYWTTVSSALAARLDIALAHVDNDNFGVGGRSEISMGRLQELSLGRIQWTHAKVSVAWRESGLPEVLVGANLLLDKDAEFTGHEIAFFSPSGCDGVSLGYWAEDVPWVPTEPVTLRDMRAMITVQVNGQPVRALIDSGAPTTILDSGAARRLGIDPDDPQAQAGGFGGIGGHAVSSSVAVFDSIAIGPEVVRHARLQIASLWQGLRDDVHRTSTEALVAEQPELVLGADFVRSHHLLFASSQRRLYFSYVGGEVFSAPAVTAPAGAATPAVDGG